MVNQTVTKVADKVFASPADCVPLVTGSPTKKYWSMTTIFWIMFAIAFLFIFAGDITLRVRQDRKAAELSRMFEQTQADIGVVESMAEEMERSMERHHKINSTNDAQLVKFFNAMNKKIGQRLQIKADRPIEGESASRWRKRIAMPEPKEEERELTREEIGRWLKKRL